MANYDNNFCWVDLNNPESANPCFSPFLLLLLYQVKTFSNKIEVGFYREKLHVNHFWDFICTFFSRFIPFQVIRGFLVVVKLTNDMSFKFLFNLIFSITFSGDEAKYSDV